MSFSFSTTAGASQSSVKARLVGNAIHAVKFDGCEIQDIKGVKDPSQTYKVIKLKFSNDDGSFEHTIFEPKDSDFVRGESKYIDKNGVENKIPQASNVENMMLLFKHAIDIISPEVAKEIDNGTKNLGAADWDGLRKLVSQILDKNKGAELEIKLIKNNKGEGVFPGFFSAINREGKAYVRNNFMGKSLAFTSYEASKINNEATAKPTKVEEFTPAPKLDSLSESSPSDIDMSFDMPEL